MVLPSVMDCKLLMLPRRTESSVEAEDDANLRDEPLVAVAAVVVVVSRGGIDFIEGRINPDSTSSTTSPPPSSFFCCSLTC